MSQAGPIDIIEAAYRIDRSRDGWLRGVIEAAGPQLEPCTFVGGYFIDASSGTGATMEGAQTLRGPTSLTDLISGFHRASPEASATMWKQAARRGAATASELLKPLGLWSWFETVGAAQTRIGVPMADLFGVTALDAAGRGLFLGCGYEQAASLDRRTRARWTQVATHLAAGERLRRALALQATAPEAVLTPSGRVEHAEGEAKAGASLTSLRARAVTIERARGRQRRADPDAALEAWRGLVSGRWTLVDRFDSDGRRYVVAHVNEPVPARILALTLRERQVVGHVLLGHPSKVVAYALGVSPAAVSAALRSALLKLGAGSVAQLLDRLGSAAAGSGVAQ